VVSIQTCGVIDPSRPRTTPVHRDTIAEHLIRRDPRAYALPAHTPVDLLEYCSVMRNNHRCYAALCGQNPASLA
jgi:hypothetical protein